MTGLLPDWVIEHLSAWSVPMIALALTTVVCVWFLPRLRPRLPTIAPLVLGLVCLLVSIVLVARIEPARLAFGVAGASWHLLWQFPVAVALTVAIGAASFLLERRLLAIRRAPAEDTGLPLALQGADIPSRGESMQGVSSVATRPLLFAGLTSVTVLGEEFLFRGLFLTNPESAGTSFVTVILVQSVLYALTHLAFGPATVASKVVLGIGLGAGAFAVGIVVSIIGHSVYQYWVYQQFAPLRAQMKQTG